MNRPHEPFACLLPDPLTPDGGLPPSGLFIDAGVAHVRVRAWGDGGVLLFDRRLSSNGDLRERLIDDLRLPAYFGEAPDAPIFITGKLAGMVQAALGRGKTFLPAATAWLAARDLIARAENTGIASLGSVDLSASGYQLTGVDRTGALKDDLLLVNPRCGAGTGINLDRVLQKLGLGREDVDPLLAEYLGDAGRERRNKVTQRADRCGVFASSATISDKNQGIPLDVALATTLKSEVLKAVRRLPPGFDRVVLTGRVFHWRYARDCATDALEELGVHDTVLDPDNTLALDALRALVARSGDRGLAQSEPRLARPRAAKTYPAFATIKATHAGAGRYRRLPEEALAPVPPDAPVLIGLDVGSTMAKLVVADAITGEPCHLAAYSNAGDTIQTVKKAFEALAAAWEARAAGASGRELNVRGIGITGSARYQVREALEHIYPELHGRVQVLVENYAHARGSIDIARRHVDRLKAEGVENVNEDLCILIDIGGEDTKVSTLALREAELFNNAMNLKCSAGTGSLMDTLAALFGMGDVAAGCAEAYDAPQAHAINATCAVFLMENASKLLAAGVDRAEILASANWAIVENMARSLWPQVDLPSNSVVLLHGQTMRSEPLPLAVTHRLQSYLGAPCHALVPPYPGHRACIGLIRTLMQSAPAGHAGMSFARLGAARFDKRVIQCRGAACDDSAAVCNRSHLTCRDEGGKKKFSFTLGGCSAINELLAKKKGEAKQAPVRDTYKAIWDFIDARHPRSEDARRVVIPRSFCVSEWAYFLARLIGRLGLPVHVDNVLESDLTDAQPVFNVDTCAPHIGAVGQYRRLAALPHGMILAPQIEYLSTGGLSLGRTCTTNQGGVAVAANLARLAHPEARFHLFSLDLRDLEAGALTGPLGESLAPVFAHYGLAPAPAGLREAIDGAIADHQALRAAAADLAADLMEEAQAQGVRVALVAGREYVLNPGIYDSHVRRLLRDQRMAVIPSYVLDMPLHPDYAHLYWRNPHFLLSLLDAVARRELHLALRHPRLSAVFRRIETAPGLLPVVQVSTFCCGPDSVSAPFVAEIMKRRPFLLIQSDAVIKELAHLENRVNTYVKQLELGLHDKLALGAGPPVEIRLLDDLVNNRPLNRDTDVIYLPTLADNRTLTAVLRGAGYVCIDNYAEADDLLERVIEGRRATGDAVCAPLAAVWGDLVRAIEDFRRRRQAGDPQLAGRTRLLYFDNQGTGPCRQGQYPEVHKLLAFRTLAARAGGEGDGGCAALGGGDSLGFLIAAEKRAYDIGVEAWTLARCHLGVVLQGVLQQLAFAGAECRDYEEYERFMADHDALKDALYRVLEDYRGPGPFARWVVRCLPERSLVGLAGRYLAWRLRDRRILVPLRRFADTWHVGANRSEKRLSIVLSGEVYMRVSQSGEVFRLLLSSLGFRRFRLEVSPLWSYMEYLLANAEASGQPGRPAVLRFVLRRLLAGPLYRAARLPMPSAMDRLLARGRALLPTLRPEGELPVYVGEAIEDLHGGTDLFLNAAPNGCMVSSMGEVLTPAIVGQTGRGRIQPLFSADGEINEDLLSLAVLKVLGPEGYYRKAGAEEGELRDFSAPMFMQGAARGSGG